MTRDSGPAWQRGLYRSRQGILFGVCRGLAEHLDFSVFWMRALWVGIGFLTTFVPIVVAYFVAALLMKPEPIVPFQTEADREFYDSYMSSREMGIHRLKRTYDNLDRRIRRMESIVTSKDYSWDKRLEQ